MAKLRVLIDSNIWINAVDKKEQKSMAKLKHYLNSASDYELFTTPLIRHEVLRGVDWYDDKRVEALQLALNGAQNLNITPDIGNLASELFRYSRSIDGPATDRRSMDLLHFATAKCHGLRIESDDKDFVRLEELHASYLDSSPGSPT